MYRFLILTILFFTGCASYKYSYTDANAPKYTGDYRVKPIHYDSTSSIHLLSYNIEFGRNINQAIDFLKSDSVPDLDILLLQEMDEHSTEKLAQSLKMHYVYFPSIYHPGKKKNVGNSILSRWDIEDSQKIITPVSSTYPSVKEMKNFKFIKIVAVATLQIGYNKVRVVSTHAPALQSTNGRRYFAQSIVDSLGVDDKVPTIIAGDFNSLGYEDQSAVSQPFITNNYFWATEYIGKSVSEKKHVLKILPDDLFLLDHIFVRDIKVINTRKYQVAEISDHYPILIQIEF